MPVRHSFRRRLKLGEGRSAADCWGGILEMPPAEAPGLGVSADASASWSAAALCRFAIYAKKTVLTLLAPKPKRQRAGALQRLRHVVAPPRGQYANAPGGEDWEAFDFTSRPRPASL
jgi:hypothetical protein